MLTVAGYSGDAGDAMAAAARNEWNSIGYKFSTLDRDNDPSGVHCSGDKACGWWFRDCAINTASNGIWWTGDPDVSDVQANRMLVKLN